MIINIFNSGISHKNQPLFLRPLNELHSLTIEFDSEEARDAFNSQFPKSLRIKAGFMHYPQFKKIPISSADQMSTITRSRRDNKTTGEINEAGSKRLARFYDAVKEELDKQNKL